MRHPTILHTLLLAACVLPAVPAADAAEPKAAAHAAVKADCLVLEDGWIRLPPAPRPMLAGFGRIVNRCADAHSVVAVRSPGFGEVSLHETSVIDGVSRMRELERMPLAPGAGALLQPGGMHLMLMQPAAAVTEGERVPLRLVLEDGREVESVLVVRKAAPAPAQQGHAGH